MKNTLKADISHPGEEKVSEIGVYCKCDHCDTRAAMAMQEGTPNCVSGRISGKVGLHCHEIPEKDNKQERCSLK